MSADVRPLDRGRLAGHPYRTEDAYGALLRSYGWDGGLALYNASFIGGMIAVAVVVNLVFFQDLSKWTTQGALTFAFVCITVIALGALHLAHCLRQRDNGAQIFERALVVRRDRRIVPMHFAAVRSVSTTLHQLSVDPRGVRHTISDGRRAIELTHHFFDVAELVADVEERVLPYRLSEALDALRAGERVRFGELALDAVALHHGPRSLPWREVDRVVEINRRAAIAIYRRGPGSTGALFASVDRCRVDNAFVLLALTDALRIASI